VSAPLLLGVLVLVAAGLSAVLVNDVVCLAMAPIVVEGCVGRHLDPRPFSWRWRPPTCRLPMTLA
jgi:Na+/H+ antiporter NhaD/arsenite permease-like protein